MVLLPVYAGYFMINASYLGKDIRAGTCIAGCYLVPATFNVAELSYKNLKMNSKWNRGESAISLALWQWILDLLK
jgi:hypothetical protein